MTRSVHPTWLVAWDEDPVSGRALEEAAAALAPLQGVVVMLHVVAHLADPFEPLLIDFGGKSIDPSLATMMKEAQLRAAEVALQVQTRHPGVRIEPVIRAGTPKETILHTAERPDIDVLVVGTHSRHGLSRILMGSVAEAVTRDAPLPVLVVPPSESEKALLPPTRIGVCMDVSWPDEEGADQVALLEAGRLANQHGAAVRMVHIVEPAHPAPALSGDAVVRAVKDARRKDLERRRERLGQFKVKLAREGVDAQMELLQRNAGEALVEALERYVEEHALSMLVVAAHRKKGLERVLGSVAGRIARGAHVPVLVVKRRLEASQA